MRKFVYSAVLACLLLCMVTQALAAPVQQATAPYRETSRGLALQQRSRVPISGVVLYEPTGMPQGGNLLEQVGPNQRCNQDPFGHRQNETPVCASPVNTNNVLAASNDYRNGDASGGFYRTTDGGTTWADALITRGPAGQFEAAGDPVTVIDNNGKMFAAYIGFDRTTPDNGVYVQTSTDNGSTWTGPGAVIQHLGGGNSDFEDKPYAACDASSGSPFLNNYYITWTHFTTTGLAPIYLSRSTNGGASFSTPMQISTSNNCQFSCPTVGPNGEVYACWFDYNSGNIMFDHSTNGGVTWGSDITVSSFDDNFPTNPCAAAFRTPAYPVIACDVSTGPRRGWLYICWADARNGNPDIFFSRSTNGGTTWSAATRVDNDNTGRWQWWQWIAANRINGDIGVSWLDRREDPTGCSYKDYATISSDGGTTWAPNFPVASVASVPGNINFLGDYCGATFRSSGFYSTWVDLRNDQGDAFSAWWSLTPTITVTAPNGGENWLIGASDTIRWTSQNTTGTLTVELNRNYPTGTWELLSSGVSNSGLFPWAVTSPATTTARVRVTSESFPNASDVSDNNFSIVQPNQPPLLSHDPLHDFTPGNGTITAIATDPSFALTVASVKMFFRFAGGSSFDSLALSSTGNPNEYAASLAAFAVGSYEYYVRALDNLGLATFLPANTPTSLYTFDVDNLCAQEMAFDDGSAEQYNWNVGAFGAAFQWAVKFDPAPGSYVLCGARFAASSNLPDAAHSPVHVAVYAADGISGMPGTLLWETVSGSVGNVIGGLPAGTNWAEVFVRDALGQPITVTSPFYIALSNPTAGQYEGFGLDTSSADTHHSYLFDGSLSQWFSEDDTAATPNAHPGNRLIRAQFFSAAPPIAVLYCTGDSIVLNWNNLFAPNYHVYSATTPGGPFNFIQATADTFLTVSTADTATTRLFYQVTSAKP